ncbi:septum formation inhibitor Maf [Vitreoscilla filiformis]|uniref:dTTP/UTP pyrophosphatase n=1 Tax=Vitreoscilla filiformis TaxID=63 RepID=A0A221KEX8_VITFI|nr:Maf family protein [Vitreoscilla filiformis]ASM77566.1 septum formation inhibitor Maf [Vitreoscilla filiformis]
MPPVLYLASQSPRRRQLLTQIGVTPELLLPDADEDAEALETERAGEAPRAYVERVTLNKLTAACARLARRGWPVAPVLCSDTTVALGSRILGKPTDEADALATLRQLSGHTHAVLTAVAVAVPAAAGWQQRLAVSVSHVRFAELPDDVLRAYVASGEPFGKAGAYAIQSSLAGWIPQIEGSYSGIMGLPLYETTQLLRDLGVHP